MLLGAGGVQRKAQWSDQNDETTWTPTSTNQAGSVALQSNGSLMCGIRTRNLTLIMTDVDAYAAIYVGLPSVFNISRVGDNCGIISRGAGIAIDARAYYMGQAGFYIFDGSNVVSIPCEVFDAVFGNMNYTQRSKIVAVANSKYDEVWWFYPSSASTEIDSYVIYNYQENHWSLGKFARLCGVDHGIFNNPIMCDASGFMYDHETGFSYTGATPTTPYAESGPAEIGSGDVLMRVRTLICDEQTAGDVSFSLKTRNWPTNPETTWGPYTPASPNSVRLSARLVRLRIDGVRATSWRWGALRVGATPGSRR